LPTGTSTASGRLASGRVAAAALAVALLVAFVLQGLAFIRANSQTSDEAVYLAAGYYYLAAHDFRLNPEHPPFIKELSALPIYLRYPHLFDPKDPERATASQWAISQDFLYRSPVAADTLLKLGRLPNLLLGVALVALVGWWSHRLWGRGAALLGMGLAAVEPNLIAHASLATNDLGAALFMFLAVYLAWEYAQRPSWPRLAAAGLAAGLAFASKYSTVVLAGILGAIVLALVISGDRFSLPHRSSRDDRWHLRVLEAALPLIVIVVIASVVVAACYFFEDAGMWLNGARDVLIHLQAGQPAFFLGEYSSDGWWSYFVVAFLIKTPVASLLLIVASLLLFRAGRPLTRRDALWLLLPVAIVFAVTSRGRFSVGLRYILVVYPFLFVTASRLATVGANALARAVVLVLAVGASALSSLRVAPHQLAYFNELVGGPNEGYRYLSDSNLDWGQDLKGLAAYVQAQQLPIIYLSYFGNLPFDVYPFRFQYVPSIGSQERLPTDRVPATVPRELLAISVMNLHGAFFKDHDRYKWLLNTPPLIKIGYSIFVYDITRDADAHLRLAGIYAEDGLRELALSEVEKVLLSSPNDPRAQALKLMLSAASPDPRPH
jgi:Dolichyl-phosphate-mannose-protein mannosyltransferase